MAGLNGICVVITAFNAERTIARAVASALDQAGVVQVVVVDDVSPDATIAAARSADDGSGRLKVIAFDANRGPSAARNAAVAASDAPFLAILDADDYFLPGRFAALRDGDWDLLADNIAFVPEGAPLPENALAEQGARQRDLSFEEFIDRNISRRGRLRAELGFLKPVIRRAALERYGLSYDERMRLGEDFILYASALARGARFVLAERCGYVAEVRAGSLSGQHRTADLVALAKADRALIAELAPSPNADLLKQHLDSIEQKIATRRLIDRRHEVGVIRAILEQVKQPMRLAGALGELVAARRNRHALIPELPPLRMLMAPEEFATAAGD